MPEYFFSDFDMHYLKVKLSHFFDLNGMIPRYTVLIKSIKTVVSVSDKNMCSLYASVCFNLVRQISKVTKKDKNQLKWINLEMKKLYK